MAFARRRLQPSPPSEINDSRLIYEDRDTSKPLRTTRGFRSVPLIVVLGVLVHATYLLSIFDIYFKTPIVMGVEPVHAPVLSGVTKEPLARRLVLAVADGLRADKLFEVDPDTGSSRLHELRLGVMPAGDAA
eukprot:jgi/Mesvir1/135/Mv26432-RA.1